MMKLLESSQHQKKKKHSSSIFKISNSFQTERVGEVRGRGRPWRGGLESWSTLIEVILDRSKVEKSNIARLVYKP